MSLLSRRRAALAAMVLTTTSTAEAGTSPHRSSHKAAPDLRAMSLEQLVAEVSRRFRAAVPVDPGKPQPGMKAADLAVRFFAADKAADQCEDLADMLGTFSQLACDLSAKGWDRGGHAEQHLAALAAAPVRSAEDAKATGAVLAYLAGFPDYAPGEAEAIRCNLRAGGFGQCVRT